MNGDSEYQRRKREWIARQLENCPPLTEHQKSVIRDCFAAIPAEREGTAA